VQEYCSRIWHVQPVHIDLLSHHVARVAAPS